MLKWIVWNRTVYLYKNGFGIDYKGWYAIKPKQTILWNSVFKDGDSFLVDF